MGRHDEKGSVIVLETARDPQPRHGSYAASIVGFDPEGRPQVEVDGAAVMALATVPVSPDDLGQPVMISFLEGDPRRPVITGLFQQPRPAPRRRHVKLRAEQLDLEAASQITLTCGKASITLHRDGKVVVKGTQLLSRASGVNRIRGGTIELN
jgi:hypothetical protein